MSNPDCWVIGRLGEAAGWPASIAIYRLTLVEINLDERGTCLGDLGVDHTLTFLLGDFA